MGNKPKKKFYKKWWFWVIVVIIVIGAIGSQGNKNNGTDTKDNTKTTASATTPKKEAPKKEEPKKDDSIKAGMYKVGTDIQPGEYVVVSTGGMCYMQLSKDSSGTLDSIICNDNIKGRDYITINAGEYLEVRDGKIYPVGKEPKVAPKDGKYPEGMYKVGTDIKAGEYKVSADGQGYVEVSKTSRHGIDDIISNDNFQGEKYITVNDGNYIKINSASLIAK